MTSFLVYNIGFPTVFVVAFGGGVLRQICTRFPLFVALECCIILPNAIFLLLLREIVVKFKTISVYKYAFLLCGFSRVVWMRVAKYASTTNCSTFAGPQEMCCSRIIGFQCKNVNSANKSAWYVIARTKCIVHTVGVLFCHTDWRYNYSRIRLVDYVIL